MINKEGDLSRVQLTPKINNITMWNKVLYLSLSVNDILANKMDGENINIWRDPVCDKGASISFYILGFNKFRRKEKKIDNFAMVINFFYLQH